MALNTRTFDDLQRALLQSHALTDAAEAHGTLVGSLCATGCSLEEWLAEILPDGQARHEAAASLQAVFETTCGALGDMAMSFQPLLPPDEDPIAERTSALGEWCQGFLYGLGVGVAVPEISTLQGEAAEVLRDMTEITHVDVDPTDSAESNEEAYAELVEFVRVGVQLLYEQLQPLRDPPRQVQREVLH
ncbi:MAG: UPF0149 family protein [Pseudomonadota bacterium]